MYHNEINSKGMSSGGVQEGVWHPDTPLPPHFLQILSVFQQNDPVKLIDPMLLVNLEYFIIKNEMQNSINIQSHRNQTFTDNDVF